MAFLFSLPLRRIHTLTTTNPCMLHRCLLSATSNSGGGVNLISKQPSPSNPDGNEKTPLDVSLITFTRNYWGELNEKLGNIRWNQLHEELIGCRGMDLFDLKRLAKEVHHQQAYLNEMDDPLYVIYNYLDNSLSCSGGF